ncbi:MAG TPA: ABC transporter permease subunit [Candidatus Krumholzibacteria bacterium]|nr:ABC transporter permease subunit [Candidatus Krumholzibacteria bacterium]
MTQYKRTRNHSTRWTVKAADRVAAICISIGGVGTIVAVSAVFLFLVSVVVPLLRSGRATPASELRPPGAATLLCAGTDEYRVAGWSLSSDGIVHVFRLDDGDTVTTRTLVGPDSLSALSYDAESSSFAIGRVDGSIRLGRIRFRTDFPAADAVGPGADTLSAGARLVRTGAVIERTAEGALRRQSLVVDIDIDLPGAVDGAVRTINHVAVSSGYVVAAVGASDTVAVIDLARNENEFTGEVALEVNRGAIVPRDAGRTTHLVMTAAGAQVFLVDGAGHAEMWNTRDVARPQWIASATVTDGKQTPTVVAPLLGRQTMLVGESGGAIAEWFTYEPADSGATQSRVALGEPRHFRGDGAAVTALAASSRDRVFAVGYADGRVRVLQATSGKRVIDLKLAAGPVDAVAISPKNDGLIAVAGGTLHHFDLNLGHPEATLRAMFRPVWYEGYPGPEHVWQSSAGTDDFEPKLGMWPLVFGTLKATFYSLLFGVPLALLAAIYTSEFIPPGVRPRIKIVVESMASLPSVVLGFLAALVIAPFVQRVVPSVMAAFVTVPSLLLMAGYGWQLLPQETSRRLSRFRLPVMLVLLPLSVLIASVLGPWLERLFFAGDMMAWLAGRTGSAFGGWFLLLLPISAIVVILLVGRMTGELIRGMASRSTRHRIAVLDLVRFLVGGLATVMFSLVGAWALSSVGLDARGGLMDTYVQRNSLVVGFVMGFAIIPIIYTIAEDALSAVPDHLRAASLGAGATPWQTAIRIVLPTAMSGLFSAIMIGLGRAVGETMIVLMAAGNTPVLEMNIFNGFRTLSANIATELPEAVRDSTHYRTLFLAALLLFLMTFIVNTVAEIVRLRFRKRSAQI